MSQLLLIAAAALALCASPVEGIDSLRANHHRALASVADHRPYKEYGALLTAMKKLKTVALKRTVYRAQDAKFPTEGEITSGAGAKARGGRWNPVGQAALYGSVTDLAALLEGKAYDDKNKQKTLYARIIVALDVKCDKALDLLDKTNTAALDPHWKQANTEKWGDVNKAGDESASQAIGRAAVEAGICAFLVDSHAATGKLADEDAKNVVLFPGVGGMAVSLIANDKVNNLVCHMCPEKAAKDTKPTTAAGTPYPGYAAIEAAINSHKLTSVVGLNNKVYTIVDSEFATKDGIFGGYHGIAHGLHWSPVGTPAVGGGYSDPVPAHHDREAAGGTSPTSPRVIIAMTVFAEKLLNLDDEDLQKALGEHWTAAAKLTHADTVASVKAGKETAAQAIGRAAKTLNFNGLIAHAMKVEKLVKDKYDAEDVVIFPGTKGVTFGIEEEKVLTDLTCTMCKNKPDPALNDPSKGNFVTDAHLQS